MAILISLNETIEQIVTEVEKLNEIEQLSVLAFIKAKKLQSQKTKSIANHKGNIKALSMVELEVLKHKLRNQHANK